MSVEEEVEYLRRVMYVSGFSQFNRTWYLLKPSLNLTHLALMYGHRQISTETLIEMVNQYSVASVTHVTHNRLYTLPH